MKKMSKKLVSLLTIMAFLLTLVPTVAFAAEPTVDVDPLLPVASQTVKVTVTGPVENNAKVKLVKSDDTDLAAAQPITPALAEGETKVIEFANVDASNGVKAVLMKADDSVLVTTEEVEFLYKDANEFNQNGSSVFVDDATEADGLEADVNEEVEFLQVVFNESTTGFKDYEGPLYVWAEVSKNQPDANFKIVEAFDEDGNDATPAAPVYEDNIYKYATVKADKNGAGVKFNVKFAKANKYRLYVSTTDPRKADRSNIKPDGSFVSAPAKFYAEGNENVVNVVKEDDKVQAFGVDDDIVSCGNVAWNAESSTGKGDCCDGNNLDLNEFEKYLLVDPNDTTVTKVTITPYYFGDTAADLKTFGRGKKVTFSTNSSAITVDPTEGVTDPHGKIKLEITGNVEGEYLVYAEADGCRIAIPVKVTPLRANDIEKVDEPEYPLASGNQSASDELTFRILDVDGNIVRQPFDEKSPIIGLDGLRKQLKAITSVNYPLEYLRGPIFDVQYEGNFFRINKKPAASKLKVKDVTVSGADEKGLYAINFKKDLVAGEYEIEVRIDNGRKAVFNFEVKDFGTAKELVLSYPTKYIELGGVSNKISAKFVDENGVRKNALPYVTLGANGYAIKNFDRKDGIVTVKNDEKYLGDTVAVTAIAEKEGLVADTELVVTDGKGGNETLTFDKKSGPVNTVNRTKIQVVDAKGNPVALGNDKVIQSMTAVIEGQSDKDAKVTAHVDSAFKADLLKKGTAELVLKSDKATSADIKVTIVAQAQKKGAIHTTYYRGTLHYVFSDKAETAGRVVVMTINSNQVIVDNNIVTIDTAAIIKNERTFVPFRALGEAFGAEFDYDAENKVVTANLEGKTVEMTVDKQEYKVNGEEATMDVAPFIQDDRTMIPVRFAAEALGFQVTPTYHEDGTTASVAFQK